jgi:hypothetical protein
MSPEVAVQRAIARAERILPGTPAPDGKRDPRWQAIIRVGEFIETHPEPVWAFTRRWGKHAQSDLRAAIACCLLEHLLEAHFELLFPRVEAEGLTSPRFANTFALCSGYVRRQLPSQVRRIERAERAFGRAHDRKGAAARRAT